MISETTYKETLSKINSKPGIRTLERIKEACDTLDRHNQKITIASVGQECEAKHGTPKESSIRNVVYLTDYIKLRGAEQIIRDEPEASKSISDPVALAYVNTLETRAKIAERNFATLKKFVSTQVPPMDIDKFLAATSPEQFGHLVKNTTPSESKKGLNEIGEILTNQEKLALFGLEVFKGVLRHKITGQILLTKEQMEVLTN